MKRKLFILVLVLMFILPSCSFFPLLQKDTANKTDPVKSAFLSSGNMFSDFFFDSYTSGTELNDSDFDVFRSSRFRKDSVLITVNSLSVLGRELASKDKALSLSLSSLRDSEESLSYSSADISYGTEKFSTVLSSSSDHSLAVFSCLADTYVKLPSSIPIKTIINEFLSSDAIGSDRFSLSRTDCRYGDAVIKDTQKITLDLEGADLSSFTEAVFDSIDPLFRLSDVKEYISNNISSPHGTKVSVYIKDGKTVCVEAVFTVSGTEYRLTAFFDSSDSYQSAKISFTKSSSPAREILSLDFLQSVSEGEKNGTVSFSFFPQEISNSTNLPSSITFNAEYKTIISQTRQNCTMNAEFEYTLFGITSSYKLPLSIVTELLDRDLSVSISLSAENAEISELDARISVTISALDSLEIPELFPENVTNVQNKEQADELLSSFFSEFGKKYPNLRYLIFKNYISQEKSSLNIVAAKNEKLGETLIIRVNDIDHTNISGNGEYLKEFTYTESEDTIFITENSKKENYTFYPSSAKKSILEDGSLIFTEKDGTVWRFFPSDMTGYYSKPITISALIGIDGLSGELSVYFSDSSVMCERASFMLTDNRIIFEGNEYEYYVY